MLLAGGHRLAGQHVRDGLLKRGRAVGHRQLTSRVTLGPAGRRGLQPREGEVVRPRERTREGDGTRIPRSRCPVDGRTAGIRQSEHPRHLVEALPGRVVQRVPEVRDPVPGEVADEEQGRMAPGDDQHHARVRQRAVLQRVGGDVPGQVVHPVQRDTERVGDALRTGETHLQGTRQPGTGGHGDRPDVGQPQSGLAQCLSDDRTQRLEVGTGGDLGHHPAEAGVLVHARRHRVPQQPPVPDQTGARLVAGRLDAQHHRRPHRPTLSALHKLLQTVCNKCAVDVHPNGAVQVAGP